MEKHMSYPLICIDGPSGTGKGTLARKLASHYRLNFLDSGALYRLTALSALKNDIQLDDKDALALLALNLDVVFSRDLSKPESILLAGDEVAGKIRDEKIGEFASKIAAIDEVRTALLDRQRKFLQSPGLVADGRDMGTVVFPQSLCKFFLTASAEIRAERRYKQLREQGKDASLADLLEGVVQRDKRDMSRSISPLKAATDAILIDSSQMSINEVFKLACIEAEKVFAFNKSILIEFAIEKKSVVTFYYS